MNKMYTQNSHKNNFTVKKSYSWQKAVTWLQSKTMTLTKTQNQDFFVAWQSHKGFYYVFIAWARSTIFSYSGVSFQLIQGLDYTANFTF